MDKPAFTPGPWRNYLIETTGVNHVVGCGYVVAACSTLAPFSEEQQANADLIAAAPALYEALKGVVAFWDSITMEDCVNDLHVQARAALALVERAEE